MVVEVELWFYFAITKFKKITNKIFSKHATSLSYIRVLLLFYIPFSNTYTMVELTFNQGILFKNLIDSMKGLVEDACLLFNENGITMQAMDSSHVSMCFMEINPSAFSTFNLSQPEILGINLVSLSKVLKCMGTSDTISLKSNDDVSILSLMFANTNKKMSFDLKLMDIDNEFLGIPEQEYSCIISVTCVEFSKIVRDLETMGDDCRIRCTENIVTFSVKGDLGDVEIEVEGIISMYKNPVEDSFSLRYLKLFTQASPLCTTTTLSLSLNMPMCVEYAFDGGRLGFFLAPRIVDEE